MILRRILLAMEIPSSKLKEWTPLADLDFILAHKVLKDRHYAEFFLKREQGREVILDNSMHELGAPLDIGDLCEAAKRVKADFTIAPDKLDDAQWTIEQYVEAKERLSWTAAFTNVIGVLVGDNPYERLRVLEVYSTKSSMICLPYRRPRIEWFFEHSLSDRFSRIHLLGMSSTFELRAWTWIAQQFPETRFSVDTAKPIKAGLLNLPCVGDVNLRNMPISSKDLLEYSHVSPTQDRIVRANVEWLRRLLDREELP